MPENERGIQWVESISEVEDAEPRIQHRDGRLFLASIDLRRIEVHPVEVGHMLESFLSCEGVVPGLRVVRTRKVHVDQLGAIGIVLHPC